MLRFHFHLDKFYLLGFIVMVQVRPRYKIINIHDLMWFFFSFSTLHKYISVVFSALVSIEFIIVYTNISK